MEKNDLKNSIYNAINNMTLSSNLESFVKNYREAFNKAYEGLNFNTLKKDISSLRIRSKNKILNLFEEFKQNAVKSGAKVYEAKNSEDACQYITDICKKVDTEYVVKSKSMTAEEIELNKFLENNSIKPIETDLGEWIIQLAKERPSHMIMPAIHKNRKEIANLFSKFTNEKIDENNIEQMVKIARKFLRDYYFKAKVGITGANIAVAEAGAIAILTNEGNARLVTTIPPVHIVILGYEKLVKSFEDAIKIIRVLPKNATGQLITVYVNWIKGTIESIQSSNRQKELHFVFLDNGRLNAFDNSLSKEALKCIRCGSCANVCPVYGAIGGHVFGHIYTGPIGVILTALFHDDKKAKELLEICTGCKACSDICPANIDIQGLMYELKDELNIKHGSNSIKKMVFSEIIAKPATQQKVAKITAKATNFASSTNFINSKIIPSKHGYRKLPSIASKTFSQLFRQINTTLHNPLKKILFYPGCAIEYLYPEIGLHLIKLLLRKNIQIYIPPYSSCCGLPALHGGDKISAKKSMYNTISSFGNPEFYDYYVVLCASCASTIKNEYPKLAANSISDFPKIQEISKKMITFSEFLTKLNIKIFLKENITFTYHVPCHQKRGLNYSAEEILKEIFPNNFIKLEESDVCCGFGGSFSFEYPEISNKILERKISYIKKTNANILLTECPGCIMQIKGGLERKGINIHVMHLTEFFEKYVFM